jgi:hypothetical protein
LPVISKDENHGNLAMVIGRRLKVREYFTNLPDIFRTDASLDGREQVDSPFSLSEQQALLADVC